MTEQTEQEPVITEDDQAIKEMGEIASAQWFEAVNKNKSIDPEFIETSDLSPHVKVIDYHQEAETGLRVKCMKMYIEDDEAILELMELSKKKARDSHIGDIQRQYAGLIGRQYQGTAGLSGLQQAGFAQYRSVFGSWQ